MLEPVGAKNDALGDDAFLWHGNQQEQLSLLFTGNGCERSNLIRLPENVVEHVADYVTLANATAPKPGPGTTKEPTP